MTEPVISGGVGIIIPPPDIRGVIDKTAQFVAKMGPEFEQRVLQEQNTPKFAFLLPQNPFRAYYEFMVKEYAVGNEAAAEKTGVKKPDALIQAEKEIAEKEAKKKNKVKMLMNQAEEDKEAPAPPPDVYTVNHPAVTPLDADVISVVAQFVARNGQKFLVGLTQRESRNPQFDFLKPMHPLFGYFTTLVDAYTKVLMPTPDDIAGLRKYVNDNGFNYVFEKAMRRFRYDDQQAKIKKAEEAKQEAEKEQLAQIDWHDFIVVETIDFTKEDDEIPLAAPMDTTKVAQTVEALDVTTVLPATLEEEEPMEIEMEVEAPEISAEVKDEVPDMSAEKPDYLEDEEKQDEVAAEEKDVAIPLPTEMDFNAPMKIRQNYVRQAKKSTPADQEFQRCPVTGQLLPVDNMNEHMRVTMLNPQWKKEQDAQAKKNRSENAFAEDVEANLAAFAGKRPDIFGTVDEEIQVAAEAGAEQSAREAGADAGPAASVYNPEAVKSLPPAPPVLGALPTPALAGMAGIMANAINPYAGRSPFGTPPPAPPIGGGPAGRPPEEDEDDEPASKRQKLETFLQSEFQWLQSHPRPVSLTIRISPDFGVNKPDVTLQVEVAKPITEFKSMLESILQVPTSRMTLRDAKTTLIMRQQFTLAFYNVADGSIIDLYPKERGGKRK